MLRDLTRRGCSSSGQAADSGNPSRFPSSVRASRAGKLPQSTCAGGVGAVRGYEENLYTEGWFRASTCWCKEKSSTVTTRLERHAERSAPVFAPPSRFLRRTAHEVEEPLFDLSHGRIFNPREIPRLRVPALRAKATARDTPLGMTAQ